MFATFFVCTLGSSSSSVIVRPLHVSRRWGCAHHSGRVTELRLECDDGIRIDAGSSCQEESSTQVQKNECLYWAVCDRMCLNLKPWWCLVLGSAGSKVYDSYTNSNSLFSYLAC